ncbi:helix-turn-helix transcriptional regulator [Promicromonospora sp. MEB111]|uniref:helix-turn-helix domain-containing protein n=1 Tax=Promicromonospora sp. MEB111 TaxID=3040301 RepID=UPI00254FD82D|nr:helix-turn-helix transcriptional regulator [Promicromonospora sp. MEB111]
MVVNSRELAGSLRVWRDRVSPADAGLSAGPRRRVPGLRRQEVAELAGLSVEYLARLEQGRAGQPSSSVLMSLARVLRLSDQERRHLFRLADQAEPLPGQIKRHITPSVQRILDRLTDTPVTVVDASWQCVLSNAMGYALTGDTTALPQREQNLAWTTFMNTPTRYVRTDEEERLLRLEVVADLREAWVRYPQDTLLRGLIAELQDVSPDFAELWARRVPPQPAPVSRTFLHPDIGPITLDCDILTVRDSDLRLLVYTAGPGTEAAGQIELLATIGVQRFG